MTSSIETRHMSVFFSDMTSKEMTAELERLSREQQQLQRNHRDYRETLGRLDDEYENSKKYPPPQRYVALKEMIKRAITSKSNT